VVPLRSAAVCDVSCSIINRSLQVISNKGDGDVSPYCLFWRLPPPPEPSMKTVSLNKGPTHLAHIRLFPAYTNIALCIRLSVVGDFHAFRICIFSLRGCFQVGHDT
jgi:hypothetical protein